MPDHQRERPRARENDVMSERLGDELLLFDTTTNRAHSLNTTAATVWQASDGTRTREQIAEHCQLDPLAVDLALDNLADSNLLADYTPPTQRVSRRTAIRRLAITGASLGIALPIIRSIVAPSAAMAASGGKTSKNPRNDAPCRTVVHGVVVSSTPCSPGSHCSSFYGGASSANSYCMRSPGASCFYSANGGSGSACAGTACPPNEVCP